MKTFLALVFLLLFTGCDSSYGGRATLEGIHQALEICEGNGGLKGVWFGNPETVAFREYVNHVTHAYCNDGAEFHFPKPKSLATRTTE